MIFGRVCVVVPKQSGRNGFVRYGDRWRSGETVTLNMRRDHLETSLHKSEPVLGPQLFNVTFDGHTLTLDETHQREAFNTGRPVEANVSHTDTAIWVRFSPAPWRLT